MTPGCMFHRGRLMNRGPCNDRAETRQTDGKGVQQYFTQRSRCPQSPVESICQSIKIPKGSLVCHVTRSDITLVLPRTPLHRNPPQRTAPHRLFQVPHGSLALSPRFSSRGGHVATAAVVLGRGRGATVARLRAFVAGGLAAGERVREAGRAVRALGDGGYAGRSAPRRCRPRGEWTRRE